MNDFYRRRTKTGKVAMVRKKSSPSGKQIVNQMVLGGALGGVAGVGYGLWENRQTKRPKTPSAPAGLGLKALASVENAAPNFESVRKLGVNKQGIKGAIDVAARAFSFERMLVEFARSDSTYQRRTKTGKISMVRKKPLMSVDTASKIATGMTIAAGGILAASLYHGFKPSKIDDDINAMNTAVDRFKRESAASLHDINRAASGGASRPNRSAAATPTNLEDLDAVRRGLNSPSHIWGL